MESELRELFDRLTMWKLKNKEQITKPIRYKHFMEDLAILLNTFEIELKEGVKFSPRVIKAKRELLEERLRRLFGINKKLNKQASSKDSSFTSKVVKGSKNE